MRNSSICLFVVQHTHSMAEHDTTWHSMTGRQKQHRSAQISVETYDNSSNALAPIVRCPEYPLLPVPVAHSFIATAAAAGNNQTPHSAPHSVPHSSSMHASASRVALHTCTYSRVSVSGAASALCPREPSAGLPGLSSAHTAAAQSPHCCRPAPTPVGGGGVCDCVGVIVGVLLCRGAMVCQQAQWCVC